MSCCPGTGEAGAPATPRSPPETPVNKVHHVWTIDRVAADLDESVDTLHDVAIQMDAEDGVIWV